MPRERTGNVCLCNWKGGFLVKWGFCTTHGLHVRKEILSENQRFKKKKILPVLPSSPEIKQYS